MHAFNLSCTFARWNTSSYYEANDCLIICKIQIHLAKKHELQLFSQTLKNISV